MNETEEETLERKDRIKRTNGSEVKRLTNLNRKLKRDIESNQDRDTHIEKQERKKEIQK